MIDCTGLDLILGETPQTITGLYAELQKAERLDKPVYACNCVWGDKGKMTPIQVMLVDFSASDYIIATASTLQIVVTSSDIVTINNMVGD